jgi:hypothetical protein
MSTSTKPRPRVKPERRVTIGEFVNGIACMSIAVIERRVRTEPKITVYGYFLHRLPADFGLAFRFEPFAEQKRNGSEDYDVNIDLARGYHSCSCKGNTYCGHCKHVESALALIKAGKIAVPQQPAPEPFELENL